MDIDSKCVGSDCRRAAQYLVAIFAVLLVGQLIAMLPIMAELKFARTLSLQDLVLFCTKLSALILFFLFIQFSIAAIPERNRALMFIRAVLKPAAVLVIVIVGQSMLWQLIDPFVGGSGKTIYYSVTVGIILIVGIWLIYTAYREAPGLIDAMARLPSLIKRVVPDRFTVCSQCDHKVSRLASFCSFCGHKMVEKLKCARCGKNVESGQHYCQHCGQSVLQKNVSNDVDTEDVPDMDFDGQ